MIHKICRETGCNEMANGTVGNGVGAFTNEQVCLLRKQSRGGAETEKLPSISAEGTENHGNFGLENMGYRPCFVEQLVLAVL
jgi:hypothetical protein